MVLIDTILTHSCCQLHQILPDFTDWLAYSFVMSRHIWHGIFPAEPKLSTTYKATKTHLEADKLR